MKNDFFVRNLLLQVKEKKSHICVGLDSDYERLPSITKKNNNLSKAIFLFNKEIVNLTHDIVVAYKPNISFYAGYGIDGLKALRKTNEYIKNNYPNVSIIADCKRSEMARSAELVAREIFDEFMFDALTVTPWFGYDTLEPYTQYKGKAVFVLCHDSNPSAVEVQDLKLYNGTRVYEKVTKLVCNKWNKTGNVLIEAPLTYPDRLLKIKNISDKKHDQFYLIAGLGAQNGNIKDLKLFKENPNFIISASRSIIFSSARNDFALAARKTIKGYNSRINSLKL